MSGSQAAPAPATNGNTDQPWLQAPIVAAAGGTPSSGGGDNPPWLSAPIVKPADTSFGSALQQGTHDALSGLGSTLGVLSGDIGWKGGQSAGQALSNAVSAPANYQSASGDMVSKLKAGKLLGALADLPRAAVEGVPSVLGGLGAAGAGAAALPEASLGVGGAALGAGAYGALSSFGQDAQARAAANNHATPTANDQMMAAPTAVAQGALGAVGLGRTPGVTALLARSPAYLEALAKGSTDAAGQAASNLVGQVGTTAGTQQGLTIDPAQATAAALQAGAARGLPIAGKQVAELAGDATGAVSGAARQGVTNYGIAQAIKGLPPMSDEQAASITRINNALALQAPANPNANGTQRMNALWKQQRAAVGDMINAAVQSGKVDQSTGSMLQTAMQQAAVHKSALDTNLLNKLNAPTIAPQIASTLRDGLTDLDGLSQMVNYRQATGPYAALASKIVNGLAVGGAALAGLHGNLGDASEIGLGALAGHSTGLTGIAGKVLGGGLDRIAGTAQPPGILLKAKALQQANAAGLDTSADAVSPVTAAGDALNALSAQQQQDALAAAAKAKAADLNEAAANRLSGQDYKNSEAGIIARANLAVQRRNILTQAAADGRLQQPMSQDELDRVSMGLSPRDPIQTSVPLGANNQPLTQAPQGAPQGPRPAVPQGQQPAPLQAATATSGGAPQAGVTLPVGWLSHFHTALGNTGIPATADNIGRALGGAVASGRITQDYANWLLANPDQFVGDRSVPFQHLVAQAMQNNGMQPSPVVAPVQVPIKHANAVQDYRNLGNSLQSQAASQSDPTLAVAIARIVASSSAQKKMDIADQVLSQRQHDAVALARAKLLLPPELFSRGK